MAVSMKITVFQDVIPLGLVVLEEHAAKHISLLNLPIHPVSVQLVSMLK
jgi:hypothetical protein